MKRMGMIGTQIIHTYPYLAYFNGFDPELVKKNAKAWMAKMLEGKPSSPQSTVARFTHVWAGEREEAERLAESCGIEKIADSPHKFVDEVDAVFVMDEEIEQRAGLMRPFLEAGKAVFVDKILSLDLQTTHELLSVAEKKGAPIAAWSQLRFAPGVEGIKKMARGGLGVASFRLGMDILPLYSIHLISAVHGAFGAGMKSFLKLPCHNGVEARVVYEDGTRVVMNFSPEVPANLYISYFSKDGCCLAEGGDKHEMFVSSSAAIEKMITELKSAAAYDEISEAARLVDAVVHAAPGEEIELR